MSEILHIDECQIYAAKTRRTFCIADCADARRARTEAARAAVEREATLRNVAVQLSGIVMAFAYPGEFRQPTQGECRTALDVFDKTLAATAPQQQEEAGADGQVAECGCPMRARRARSTYHTRECSAQRAAERFARALPDD